MEEEQRITASLWKQTQEYDKNYEINNIWNKLPRKYDKTKKMLEREWVEHVPRPRWGVSTNFGVVFVLEELALVFSLQQHTYRKQSVAFCLLSLQVKKRSIMQRIRLFSYSYHTLHQSDRVRTHCNQVH